jgi:hypothetical protein
VAIDRHPWALDEAARTYRAFHLSARTRRADVAAALLPKSPALVVAAYAVNELSDEGRGTLLRRLLDRAAQGDRLLIIEPLAYGVTPWWREWQNAFEHAGGRADEWRRPVVLPGIVQKLDRAAGLNHDALTGRSLWLNS